MNSIRRFVIPIITLLALAAPAFAAEEGGHSTLPMIAVGMAAAAIIFLVIGIAAGVLTSRDQTH